MSDVIRLLPDSVANQIAAGEVIQRPASVVKELVENAVDAGATEIQIVIKDAGRTLIQVVDNGKGMSPADARLAFERHATSKISQAADLFALHTMGFRGEALPSICAISQVELRTMPADATMGTRLLINGSKVELQEPVVCTRGSNFMVKNLFYNVPARRKFLKSDSVELANVMREFERLALVNHSLRLTLTAGSRVIDLRPGSFKQRITDLWKQSLDRQLIPIEVDTEVARISGFVTRPQSARRRGALQYLIVNGRNMQHPYFRKAILNCYEGIIAHDTQPSFFLRFKVDPSTIDVNIHPTKSEIKFEQEGVIRPILEAAVRAALGKFGCGPAIDFTQDVMPLNPARDGDFVQAPAASTGPAYNPFDSRPAYNPTASGPTRRSEAFMRERASVQNWESLYTGFMSDGARPAQKVVEMDVPDTGLPGTDTPAAIDSICLQVADKYIVTPSRDGLCIVDQHRAHVRVLYDRYMQQLTPGSDALAMQKCVFPEILTLDADQCVLLDSVLEEMERLGFLLSKGNSPGEWRIEGTPASLRAGSAADVVMKIIESVGDDITPAGAVSEPGSEALLSKAALVMARAAAMRRGRHLTAAEMEQLLSDLFSLPEHAYTPAGNPIIRNIPTSRLDSLFS